MYTCKRLILGIFIVSSTLPALAQSEGGMVLSAEAEKKINKQLSLNIEAAMRTRNDFKTMDRWSVGLGASYKLTSWLKADAGYMLLDDNNREKTTYKASGAANKWRPSYWGLKHRVYASLTGSYRLGNGIKLSLRERWQYTYRPETTVKRWDYDDEEWEDKVRNGKGKSVLRSRFGISYDKKKALLAPYAHIELYNAWGIEKVRYTLGTDIKLGGPHTLTAFYRFQDMRNVSADDYDPDMHYLGIGYKFKF
ncbi:DUF2490 domain-containing protein [Prevotella sp. P6B1]|uniref:DUF2490 domain-containing protein n=1 Tax=Prevotella sp. P6B1 TaxID=1410613 RepID=UPI00051C18E4|nr:DUF2490 domain-containing protein [Prevotella sp. P6B1]